MRSISNGTILYGFDSVGPAKRELLDSPVWVAPNALYKREDVAASQIENATRNEILYVGRLEPQKKVGLLIDAFAASGLAADGIVVVIAGTGSCLPNLRRRVDELDLSGSVSFVGDVYGTQEVAALYSRALCAVSPGYAGLGLTQSIGFGVQVATADDEPHSPEIELVRSGAITFFSSDNVDSFASTLRGLAEVRPESGQRDEWSSWVAARYVAESMAAGLLSALRDEIQMFSHDGRLE
jgi:glycosyltransferase involved in cell wall biosynthesis